MRIEASRVGRSASRVRRCVLVAWIALCASLPSATALAKAARCRVIAVKLFELAGGGSEVMVRTDRAPNYSARVAQQGKRLVVDLRDATIAGAEPAITDFRGVVGGVMTQSFQSQGAQTTRILVQLLKPAAYRITSSPQGLRIILSPSDRTQAAPATSEPRTPAKGEKPQLGRTSVRNIRFERQSDGDHVIVEVEGAPRYSHFSPSDTRGVLELADAVLPNALQRTLDVSAFGGRVRAISIYRREAATMIDVDHASGVSGTVLQHANTLHYVFSEQPLSSMQTGVAPDGQVARQIQTLSSPEAKLFENAAEEWSSDPDVARAFSPGTTPMQQQQRFTGRRIDLDLKEADIHDVFRTLAKVGRVNIVAADDVSGNVTITMRNVPWDQALDTILQAKKLGMVRRGNIIRVANMADLNKERELALERRKAELQLAPIETRLVPVSYAQANDMQKRAQDLLSPRGTIAVDERTNVLIIRDVAGNLNQIEELIRALDTQTPQVLIEARIVEATSRFQRDVGIQWGGDLVFGPGTGNETGLVFPSSIGVVGGASDQNTPTAGLSPIAPSIPNPNFAVNLPATVGTGAGGALGLTFGSIDNTVNLNVRISAAEATGMLRIVSSPRILTLDNAEARITQGTLIPFSQISAQGVQTVFQEAKLQLLVTPHVTADGSVSMHVKINRDEPDFNQTSARGDPTILKREAETELLVRDGHTAVIGGIYTRNTGRNLDQVPLLGDIPVLGVLFQRRRSSDTRSELVIFLTPRIVNRAEALGQ